MVVVRKKAGSTFAYSGVVKGLAPGINWGVAASAKLKSGTTIGVPLHTTLTKASDYNTSGKWLLTLRATSAETMVWWASAQNTYSDLTFDIKFYNLDAPDPVVRSETIIIKLDAPVTP